MILTGFLASLLAGLATGVGATPLLVLRGRLSRPLLDGMLGFTAGVMLAATAFGLLSPALELGGLVPAGGGLLLGAGFIYLLDRRVPHAHFQGIGEGPASGMSRAWLLFLAIALHNIPEGLAVGVIFGSGQLGAAIALAVAIGLHNLPEGLAVATAFFREGYRAWPAVGLATVTGLAEPAAALVGALVVGAVAAVLPWGLALAGGAMLYVVSDELIPESHRGGHQVEATAGVVVGFLLMMALGHVLG